MAFRALLQQADSKEIERILYRLGYEYAKAIVMEMPIRDLITTIKTYLYTATAYNRLYSKPGGDGDEVRAYSEG